MYGHQKQHIGPRFIRDTKNVTEKCMDILQKNDYWFEQLTPHGCQMIRVVLV